MNIGEESGQLANFVIDAVVTFSPPRWGISQEDSSEVIREFEIEFKLSLCTRKKYERRMNSR